jgi:hypothetical protein
LDLNLRSAFSLALGYARRPIFHVRPGADNSPNLDDARFRSRRSPETHGALDETISARLKNLTP